GLSEKRAPDVLGAAEDLGDELAQFVLRRAAGCLPGFLRACPLRGDLLGDVGDDSGIDAEEVGDEGDDDAADSQSAADAEAAAVLDVAACALIAQLHGPFLRKFRTALAEKRPKGLVRAAQELFGGAPV